MPGLSGLFSYYGERDFHGVVRDAMQRMLHTESHSAINSSLGNAAFFRIDIARKHNRNIYRDPDANLLICFWGDLFDINSGKRAFADLKQRGPEFIIADMYKEYGCGLVEKINGDFNCAIYDGQKNKLLLFNDRFGYRPLYLYHDQDLFFFSAELKGFLEYPEFDRSLDEQSLSDYLRYGYVFGDRTLFAKVSLLPPATILEIDSTGISQTRYWSPCYTETQGDRSPAKLKGVVEQGHELFRQSISRNLKDKKEVLIFLTGGLDSRLITALTAQNDVNITTATLGGTFSYEYKLARQVCRSLELEDPLNFPIQDQWIHKFLPNLLWQSEATNGSLGLTWQHGIDNQVGTSFDCMLNGIFGGHLCFGSPYFSRTDLSAQYSHEQQLNKIDRGFNGHLYKRLEGSLRPEFREKMDKLERVTLEEEIGRAKQTSDKWAYQQDAVFLYNRIRRGMVGIDQNSLYYIDNYPFASYELYEFYLQLTADLSLDHFLYKELYKQFYPELARIPWWATGTDLYGGTNQRQMKIREIANQASWYAGRISGGHICFVHPWSVRYEEYNFRKSSLNREFLRSIVTSEQCRDRNLYDGEGIETLFSGCMKGRGGMTEIGRLVMLELWLQYFVDDQVCIDRHSSCAY